MLNAHEAHAAHVCQGERPVVRPDVGPTKAGIPLPQAKAHVAHAAQVREAQQAHMHEAHSQQMLGAQRAPGSLNGARGLGGDPRRAYASTLGFREGPTLADS
jgi:hypothetical protein